MFIWDHIILCVPDHIPPATIQWSSFLTRMSATCWTWRLMRTPATLNSMHGRVSSRLSLSSSSSSPHRCFAQIHYKVDWLRNDATIFYWFDTTISCARHASSKNFTVLFLWQDDVHAGFHSNVNCWPISLIRLGSSFVIAEIMSVPNTSPICVIPLFYPSASHPHTIHNRKSLMDIMKTNFDCVICKGKAKRRKCLWSGSVPRVELLYMLDGW